MDSNDTRARETSIHDRLNELAKSIELSNAALERILLDLLGESVPSDPYDVNLGAHGRLISLVVDAQRCASLADRVRDLVGTDPRLDVTRNEVPSGTYRADTASVNR